MDNSRREVGRKFIYDGKDSLDKFLLPELPTADRFVGGILDEEGNDVLAVRRKSLVQNSGDGHLHHRHFRRLAPSIVGKGAFQV